MKSYLTAVVSIAGERVCHPAHFQVACRMEGLESRQMLSATLLKDINSAGIGVSSLPEQFHVVGSQVLFLAYDAADGQMLWSTNGTPAGTHLIKDINPNPQGGADMGFGGDSIVIGNELYFTGVDSTHGVELWKSDGTSDGTQIVTDLIPGTDGSYPAGFVNFNGKLAFVSMGQLYVTDGTSDGTVGLGNYSPLGTGGTPDRMTVMGNELYFMRYGTSSPDGHSTGELWQTDGTVAGTHLLVDVSPGNDGQNGINSEPSDLMTIGSELYFAADDGSHGWELWKSDGTVADTAMVADLAPPPTADNPVIDGSYPSNLTNLNGTLFFTASPDGTSTQLYRIDSTTGLPVIVRPVANGGPASAQNLTTAGNLLFFTASDSTHGNELWRSDGTSAGTYMVKDINPGPADSNIANLTANGSKVYFRADDGTHGAELWVSDGTAEGTMLAADVLPGSDGSNPGPMVAFRSKLIFAATDTDTGRESYALSLDAPASPAAALVASDSKGVSKNNRPVVIGTAPAGATVYLFADGVQVGSTAAGSDGSYSVSSDIALGEGKHALSTSDAVNGQTSKLSRTLSYTVDTKRPTVRLVQTAPAEIDVKFSEDVSGSFGRGDFTITDIDTGVRISVADVRVSYNTRKNTAAITFKHLMTGVMGTGHYRLRFSSTKITDAAANDLAAASFGFTISAASRGRVPKK